MKTRSLCNQFYYYVMHQILQKQGYLSTVRVLDRKNRMENIVRPSRSLACGYRMIELKTIRVRERKSLAMNRLDFSYSYTIQISRLNLTTYLSAHPTLV